MGIIMSQPPPPRPKPQTPPSAPISSPESRTDRREDLRKSATETVLVASGTTGTNIDATTESSSRPTNADSEEENVAVEPGEDRPQEARELVAATALVELVT